MKNYLNCFIIHIFFVIFVYSNDINRKCNSFLNNQSKNELNDEYESGKIHTNKNRKLEIDDDGFKSIRIFIDKTYITKNFDNEETLDKVIFSLDKCVKLIEEIIKVQQLDKVKFTDSEINTLGFNENEINSNLLPTGEGISADLIIFPKFVEMPQKSQLVLAIGRPEIFDQATKRPIGAILSINKNIPTIPNTQSYLESVFLHQITHILGFMHELFDKFEIGIDNVIIHRLYLKKLEINL